MKYRERAFTLLELLIIVAIIGILIAVVVAPRLAPAKRKAAITAYKVSMDSVRSGSAECIETDSGNPLDGTPGDPICSVGSKVYPTLASQCNTNQSPVFYFTNQTADGWEVTTKEGPNAGDPFWDCQGCRIVCRRSGCYSVETNAGDCN